MNNLARNYVDSDIAVPLEDGTVIWYKRISKLREPGVFKFYKTVVPEVICTVQDCGWKLIQPWERDSYYTFLETYEGNTIPSREEWEANNQLLVRLKATQ